MCLCNYLPDLLTQKTTRRAWGLHSTEQPYAANEEKKMAQYEHRDASNEWHQFSYAENEIIERAYRANKNRNKVHLTMPLNPVGFREFEIRFGDSARSKKMPRPPSTKIIQVNVASGATRVVRRIVPIDQPTMAPTLQYHGPASKRVVPMNQPTMAPTDAAPDWAAAKGAAPGGRVKTESYCGKYTLIYSICFCGVIAPLFIFCTFDAREVYIDPWGKRYPGPVVQNWAPAY